MSEAAGFNPNPPAAQVLAGARAGEMPAARERAAARALEDRRRARRNTLDVVDLQDDRVPEVREIEAARDPRDPVAEDARREEAARPDPRLDPKVDQADGRPRLDVRA